MTTTTTPDHAINAIAAGNHGLVTRAQLLTAGLRPGQIDHRLASGRLERVQPEVYRAGGSPPSTAQQLVAACLASGPLAGASHRAACACWGVSLPETPPDEIIVPYRSSPELTDVIVHRSLDLEPSHLTIHDGVPVTTPTRTIADLGAVEPWWRVERALEQMLVAGLTTIEEVRAFREQHARKGRRGLGVLGQVLDRRGLGDRTPESVLEAMLATLLAEHGVEMPEYQHEVVFGGRRRVIDFAYPRFRIAIEVLGFEPHTRRTVFEDDCVRGNELALHGWLVLEFTWNDVLNRPEYVATVVRRALRDAEARSHG